MKKLLLIPLLGMSLSSCNMIQQTMWSLERNREAIDYSTQVINENAQAIEQANRGIEENQRQLNAINKALEKAAKS